MIELGVELLIRADLQAGQPLGAQRIEPVDAEAGAQVVLAVALKIIDQIQAQAQVVGAGAAAGGVYQQGVVALIVHHLVGDAAEVVGTVNGAHVGLQARQIERLADLLTNHAEHYVVGHLATVVYLDRMDDGLALGPAAGQIAAGITAGRRNKGQYAPGLAQALGAGVNGLLGFGKAAEAHITQRGLQQQIGVGQGGQLALGVGAGEQGGGLVHDVEHRI